MAVSDDSVSGNEMVLTDHEPVCKGDAIQVHCVHTGFMPNYGVKTVWGWVKSLYWY